MYRVETMVAITIYRPLPDGGIFIDTRFSCKPYRAQTGVSMTKSAFISGVSTGIGEASARVLLEQGFRVFGSVRKAADAAKLEADFPDRFTSVIMDVTNDKAVQKAAATVEKTLGNRKLDALVNNSGIAVVGPVAHLPVEDVIHQMDVNVIGMYRVIQAFLPVLGMDKTREGKSGKVINISSVAGKIASPIFAPYSMSKHAVEALTNSLRRELVWYGIDAIIVGPGAVKTPIWDKTDDIDHTPFKGTDYEERLKTISEAAKKMGEGGVEAREVGELIHRIIENPKPKTRYAILNKKFLMFTLPRLLPTRTLDKILAKNFGLT